jgi:hypothetical protein
MTFIIQKSFLEGLDISSGGLFQKFRQEYSRDQNGQVYAKDLGDPIWTAKYTTTKMLLGEAIDLEAKLLGLNGSLGVIRLFDVRRPKPKNSTSSSDFTTVNIQTINANRKSFVIDPASTFTDLSVGDFIQINQSSIRFLYKIIGDDSGEFQVWPNFDDSISDGKAITLEQPSANFKLDPETLDTPIVGLDDGTKQAVLTFSAIQTLEIVT